MANKERGKDDQQMIEPGEEYRTRFMYCSIGATLMCVGVIILVSGMVVYILSSTGPHTYVNNISYWPIIVAIILSSSGIAFITIAIVFTLFACFSHGRIEDHFRNQHQISPQPVHRNNNHHSQHFTNNGNNRQPGIAMTTRTPVKATHDPYEEERLISSPTPIPAVHPSSITTTQYPIHHQSQIYPPASNINQPESNEPKRNGTHHHQIHQPSQHYQQHQQKQQQSHASQTTEF
ncbi:hypothetical protein BLA29_009889, partial [Euroglyphus maynei]